jgi:hypothetical protein
VRWWPGDLRHTDDADEGCSIPGLTWFTGARCTGPDHHLTRREPDVFRWRQVTRRIPWRHSALAFQQRMEGCESGRIGTLGKRVRGNLPWVRIPPPPPVAPTAAPFELGSRSWSGRCGARISTLFYPVSPTGLRCVDTIIGRDLESVDAFAYRGPRVSARQSAGSHDPGTRRRIPAPRRVREGHAGSSPSTLPSPTFSHFPHTSKFSSPHSCATAPQKCFVTHWLCTKLDALPALGKAEQFGRGM